MVEEEKEIVEECILGVVRLVAVDWIRTSDGCELEFPSGRLVATPWRCGYLVQEGFTVVYFIWVLGFQYIFLVIVPFR
ncbi:hypothetical protein IMY05_005G0002500 [Salix suchowensis]|nr:hypothetical protein IMY05_005G0002500 [Salix suchowensis]